MYIYENIVPILENEWNDNDYINYTSLWSSRVELDFSVELR